MVFLLQKGECNLKKPYHSVLNMSLSVLMLPYYVHLLYRTAGEGFGLTEHLMNVSALSCDVHLSH